ncbi:MAG: tetratricopeptide repeat protein [Terracidiphilus sp.]
MTDTNPTSIEKWTRVQSNSLAAVCLLVGIAGGWLIRGLQSSDVTGSGASAGVVAPARMGAATASQAPSPARLKDMADTQAAPILDKLKSDPDNPELLTGAGNLYYDAQQYSIAVDYYGRALKAKPSDAAVRTDMATAYWYMGNADKAIAEFNRSLTYEPNKPNTLFNLGVVKWRGKKDSAGAIADWEKLLAANPDYAEKDQVKQMIAEAKGHGEAKP